MKLSRWRHAWRRASLHRTARVHDLSAEVLEALIEGGMRITLA
jgi:hypothetical protein